jgi:uncharacterized protein YgbK (DUF1537 family)
MRLRPDYVPTRVEDAVQEILNNLTEKDIAFFFQAGGEVSNHLTTFGFQIRDAWRLSEEKSPLVRHCKMHIGPSIPEGYALFILDQVWTKLSHSVRSLSSAGNQRKDSREPS